ncbi:FERM domain-containing protein 4A [Halotydeus destructor]|nr:FERM domain-containing protein 4A [Halotydeus destructor]
MLQTSKVRRSISCYSLPALGVADAEDHEEDERAEERREMHEALRVRKEALESAMQAKLAELKALCLREAELTGVLPAETPLRPNEPRPVIRRRMRTEFALSDKLLTEPTSKDEETLANLELEFEIQNKIVAASLKLMNELQTNKSIRKHRKQAYDDAVRKLNTLEQKLVPLRNKLDEVRRGKGRKKQLIIDELNKDSGISDVNIAPGTDLHTKRIKKKRLKIGNESSANPHSVPSSPMHVRHDSVPSQKTVHIPESPVEERHRNHSQYPNVAKLMPNQRSSLKSLSRKMVDSDTDTVSLNSDGMASVIIHDDVRERSDPTLLAHRFRYRPATAVGLPTTDSQLYKDKESAGSYQKSARASPIDNLAELKAVSLVRTNSLDNSRRKSYISAITSPPSAVSLQHNYMNNHPLRLMRQPKTLPKNPPPPIPVSEHFLQRPLPPPPVTHSSSVPDVTSPISEQENVEPQLIASANGSLRRHHRKRQDSEIDISARAVRSSVIRTPVGITISTTSSSETQHNHGSNVLPPTPVKGASKMIPLPPKPMEEDRISVFSLQTVAESACNWPDQQSDIPSRPSSVASSRSFSSAVYKPLPSHVDNLQGPMQRSSVVSNQDSSQALASDELEGIKFRQDFNSETRDNVETPRPQSIPLAPSVVSTGGQVDVVAVGHFTPYWEETKPYELSDFYKYSAKHRKQAMQPPTGDPNQDPKPSISGNNSVIDRSKHSSSGAEFKSNQQAINQPLSSRLHGEHLQPPNESLLNESFITRAAVADDFHEEMLDWYDQNLKKPTVV